MVSLPVRQLELPHLDPLLARELHLRSSSADPIATDLLRDQGYHVFPHTLPSADWFRSLYDAYDALSEALAHSPGLLVEWNSCVDAWKAVGDNEQFFCRVPPIFRDRSERTGKRNKEYLQFMLDFARSPTFRRSVVGRHPLVKRLFLMLEELHYECVRLFSGVVLELGSRYGRVGRSLDCGNRLSPVVLKLIRYNRSPERFATNPHVDKSALSILLHSDDDQVTYRVAKPKPAGVRYSDFLAPIHYPAAEHLPNHAVMIPGACLDLIGIKDMPGTPHAVWPVSAASPRHSLVAFYLAPYADTDGLVTDVDFVNDVLARVS